MKIKLIAVLLSLAAITGCSVSQTDILKGQQFCRDKGGVVEIYTLGSVICLNGDLKNSANIKLDLSVGSEI